MVWLIFLLLLLCKADLISKPKNQIIFDDSGIPITIAKSMLRLQGKGQFEILTTHEQTYLCYLPEIELLEVQVPESKVPLTELKLRALNIIHDSFHDNCSFNYNILASYWTIGYCFGDKVIQFHEEIEDYMSGNHRPSIPDHVYTLGRFPESMKYNKKVKIENQVGNKKRLNPVDFTIFDDYLNLDFDGQNTQKFIKHTLTDGEICDLTSKPRSIDIIYKCDQNYGDFTAVLEIQEIKTCHYQMVINVPGLCAIDEFRKNIIHDNVVDIRCKKIDTDNNHEYNSNVSYDDFFGYTSVIPIDEKRVLPNRNNFKIDLNDYHLHPMGSGYYLGTRNESLKTQNPYWNQRMIFIYALEDVNQFPSVFASFLDRKVPSPVYISENVATPLLWTDTFIAWYEIYNIFGNFIGLYRIQRDGSMEKHQLDIQKVDPVKMVDEDGDSVVIEKFQAPYNQWNFESFTRPNLGTENKVTETVTVTISEPTEIVNLTIDPVDVVHDEL